MSASIPNRFAWCLAALVAVTCVLVLSVRSAADAVTFVEQARAQSWTSGRYELPVRTVANMLTGRGEFTDGVNVNGPPASRALNIYIVDVPAHRRAAVRERFPRFVGTIAYLGQPNLVLIDERYLDSVGERLGFLSFSGNPHVQALHNSQRLQRLLLWVLGHELGHLTAGRQRRHFLPSALESLAGYTKATYRQEVAADEAFALRLSDAVRSGRLPQADLTALGIELTGLANAELMRTMGRPRKEGPMIHFFDPEESVPTGTGSHPEFFLRAIRILARLELPADSGMRAVQREVRKFEARLRPVTARAGRLIVEGDAAAAIFVSRGEMTRKEYRVPAEVWLSPGEYTVTAQLDGYRTSSQIVLVVEGHATHHLVRLTRMPTDDPFGFRRWEKADTHVSNGRSYAMSQATPDAALWELVRAREADPTWSLPVMLEAELRLRQGAIQEARALFKTALELARTERPWMRKSPYQIMKFEGALEDAAVSSAKGTDAAEAHFDAAEWAWIVDELDVADAHLTRAATHPPLQPRVDNLRALIALDRHELLDAERAATDGVKLGSRDARLTLARILNGTGRAREAEQALLAALRDHPSDADALRALAEHYVAVSRPVDALAAYLRAAATDPDTEAQWCEIGALYHQLGDVLGAERAFRRPDGRLRDACTIGLARLRAAEGQREAAIDICRERPSGSVANELAALAECEGDLLTSAGDRSSAARAFGESVWLQPYSSLYRRKLAQALLALGQRECSSIHSWVASLLERLPPR